MALGKVDREPVVANGIPVCREAQTGIEEERDAHREPYPEGDQEYREPLPEDALFLLLHAQILRHPEGAGKSHPGW